MKKYTDVQLSRILSASAAGVLGPPTSYGGYYGTSCIEQAALADNSSQLIGIGDENRMWAFDNARKKRIKFRKSLSNPQFIANWILKNGMA